MSEENNIIEPSITKLEENNICIKCGATFKEDQFFCDKCGVKRQDPNKIYCGKCGVELEPEQEFCAQCGQRVGVEVDEKLISTINAFNQGFNKKKSNNKMLKLILLIGIPIIIIGIVISVFWNYLLPFGGEYIYVGGETISSYSFTDGRYKYKSSDTDKIGTYKFEKGEVIIKDGADDITFIRSGEYIFKNNSQFTDEIISGKNFNQTFKYSDSFTYEGATIYITIQLKFNKDGTYYYENKLSSSQIDPIITKENGTYIRKGSIITLSPDAKSYSKTIIIHNMQIYQDVYKKK